MRKKKGGGEKEKEFTSRPEGGVGIIRQKGKKAKLGKGLSKKETHGRRKVESFWEGKRGGGPASYRFEKKKKGGKPQLGGEEERRLEISPPKKRVG